MGSRTTLITAVTVIWASLVASSAALAQCDPGFTTVKGGFGELRFRTELADEPSERAQGLMNREHMARMAGMLFVFDPPRPVAFWMKNTLIPLDMIFADRAGVIRNIHSNAIPHDTTPIPGDGDIYAVLEINGGLAAQLGISAGDALQHPVFVGGPAALPCD